MIPNKFFCFVKNLSVFGRLLHFYICLRQHAGKATQKETVNCNDLVLDAFIKNFHRSF